VAPLSFFIFYFIFYFLVELSVTWTSGDGSACDLLELYMTHLIDQSRSRFSVFLGARKLLNPSQAVAPLGTATHFSYSVLLLESFGFERRGQYLQEITGFLRCSGQVVCILI
jgi:hypothetical protein